IVEVREGDEEDEEEEEEEDEEELSFEEEDDAVEEEEEGAREGALVIEHDDQGSWEEENDPATSPPGTPPRVHSPARQGHLQHPSPSRIPTWTRLLTLRRHQALLAHPLARAHVPELLQGPYAASRKPTVPGSSGVQGESDSPSTALRPARVPSHHAAGPDGILEQCEVTTTRVRLGGDVAHVGGGAHATRLLSDVSGAAAAGTLSGMLAAPAPGQLCLVVHAPDTDTVTLGVKLLLGASGPNHLPSSVRFGPGACSLTPARGGAQNASVATSAMPAATGCRR
ncbi:hypothetical protein V8C86DRAFT_2774496, partial [Haematococcus lacustris]